MLTALEARDVPAVVYDNTFTLTGSGGEAEVVSPAPAATPTYIWNYTVTNISVGANAQQPYLDSDASTMFWVIANGPVQLTDQYAPAPWDYHTWDYLGSTGIFYNLYAGLTPTPSPAYLPHGSAVTLSFVTATVPIVACDATFGDDAFGEATGTVAGPGSGLPTSVSGRVWLDNDFDGLQDDGSADGLAGMTVHLVDSQLAILRSTTTDSSGAYEFEGLSGDVPYRIRVANPSADVYQFSPADIPGDDNIDSDVDADGYSAIFLASANKVDAGVKASGNPKIVLTGPDGAELTADQSLKVAKWNDAFENAKDGQGKDIVRIKGPDANGHDFIDRDLSRFNVRVYDPVEWGKGTKYLDVTLETKNVAGFETYDDNPTKLTLVRTQTEGWWWSDSQILVSYLIDDMYTDANVGTDNADPSATQNNIKNNAAFPVSDRTHLIALGGKVIAKYGALPAAESVAKVAKTIKLNITIFRDKASADGGVVVTTKDQVLEDASFAREHLAQIGIQIAPIADANIKYADPPIVINDAKGYDAPGNFRDANLKLNLDIEEVGLLGDETLRTAANDDIEVYYVTKISSAFGPLYGLAYPSQQLKPADQKYAESVVISNDLALPNTLPHELVHVLENITPVLQGGSVHYPYTGAKATPLDNTNLIAQVSILSRGTVTAAMRLNVEQQERALKNRPNLLS